MENPGKKIYEWRNFLGLTQIEFAEKVKYDLKTVNAWENNRNTPHLSTIRRVAERLGIDYQKFIQGPVIVDTHVKREPVIPDNAIDACEDNILSPVYAFTGIRQDWDSSVLLGFQIRSIISAIHPHHFKFVFWDCSDYPEIPYGSKVIICDKPAAELPDDDILVWTISGKIVKKRKDILSNEILLGKIMRVAPQF